MKTSLSYFFLGLILAGLVILKFFLWTKSTLQKNKPKQLNGPWVDSRTVYKNIIYFMVVDQGLVGGRK